VRGGKRVLDQVKQELGIDVGGTTDDRVFSLEVARCFGACGLAPTMMIDEDVHQRVKPQKLRGILELYRDRGAGGATGAGGPTSVEGATGAARATGAAEAKEVAV
jgi:(2Fe-2S) ferredoxin